MADAEEMKSPRDGCELPAYQSWKSLSPELTNMRTMQKRVREDWEKMLMDHKSVTFKFKGRCRQLEERTKALERLEDKFQGESRDRMFENTKNLKRCSELKKSNEELKWAGEAQERENDELKIRITQLQCKLKGKESELKTMKERIELVEEMNQDLIVKDQKSNDELQEARKELINGLKELPSSVLGSFIGIKNMGELDFYPFYVAMKKRYSEQESFYKALKLCSRWEHFLKDQSWNPFKVETVEGNSKEVIDVEDERLKTLKSDYGDEVYAAVITALSEMNEYNLGGRCITEELWNNFEGRKATLKETMMYMLMKWRLRKLRVLGNGCNAQGNDGLCTSTNDSGTEASESDHESETGGSESHDEVVEGGGLVKHEMLLGGS